MTTGVSRFVLGPLLNSTTPVSLASIESGIPWSAIDMTDSRPNALLLVDERPGFGQFREKEPSTLSGLTYRAGQQIPTSGIYLVEHFRHRDGHEVTLIRNERFPFCQKCGFGVVFTLVQAAPELDSATSPKIVLHQIPDVSDSDPEAA